MSQGPYNPYQSPWGSPGQPQGPNRNIVGKVAAPAIALMVLAGFDMLAGVINVTVGTLELAGVIETVPVGPGGDREALAMIQNLTGAVRIGIGMLILLFAVVILMGAIKMKALQSFGLAMTSSILAMMPCSPCCLFGLPIGIWAVVVLADAQVKQSFR